MMKWCHRFSCGLMDPKLVFFAVPCLLCTVLGHQATATDNATIWHPLVREKIGAGSKLENRFGTIPMEANTSSFLEIGTTLLVRIAYFIV